MYLVLAQLAYTFVLFKVWRPTTCYIELGVLLVVMPRNFDYTGHGMTVLQDVCYPST